MRAQFIEDPNDPGHCTPIARFHATAKLTVRDEAGHVLCVVEKVTGHFLDDYWLDQAVTGRTTPRERSGLCTTDRRARAVAFRVTRARMSGRTFDRTTGKLADWVIPA